MVSVMIAAFARFGTSGLTTMSEILQFVLEGVGGVAAGFLLAAAVSRWVSDD
jgi:NhaP-type Na+/H+ or K+/H+ antiporter